ncbi:DUF6221 family protein [Nocardiopsis lambiniae]|uniref:DUF6221 family protein n=1 Tax=Nocardiopsis lambiniae TaxID=3075539 RepID=A0ABU2MH45_9ACTN|nr:DUF6221 family protein [Nocardiopsis sp. DSM 44743]MDT0332025.1 DUF6221 family protein [Nocardiopsis sp. DSM 44743]
MTRTDPHLGRSGTSMTIVEFLNARLDEEQAVARKARPGPWHADGEGAKVLDGAGSPVVEAGGSPDTARHIARHHPERVLREVALRRRMIQEIDEYTRFSGKRLDGELARQVLGALAGAYSDHPDHRAEWTV